MNSRNDDRIGMKLLCRVHFPEVWPSSTMGITSNIHRNGMMLSCRMKPGRLLPALGSTADVRVELPPNENFPPKLIRCEATLLRIEHLGNQDFYFALTINNVDFEDSRTVSLEMMESDTETCGYLM